MIFIVPLGPSHNVTLKTYILQLVVILVYYYDGLESRKLLQVVKVSDETSH